MVKVKKGKPKIPTKELMDKIVDKLELERRKEKNISTSKESSIVEENNDGDIEKKWWQLPINKKDFIKKNIDNKYYGHHKDWKEHIWIGAYDSEKELDKVIKSYVDETKKPPMYRKIENIHSIIIEI